jgi:hypothetical protein
MTIYDRLKHGVDVTKFKADQAMRIREIQSEIDSVRRDISIARDQIATATLNLHKEGVTADDKLEELCVKIDQFNEQIKLKDNLIASIRAEPPPRVPQSAYQHPAANPCPNCRFDVPIGSLFCTNCGNTMPEPSGTVPNASPGSKVFCTNCGNQLPVGAEFCTHCGQKYSQSNVTSEKEEK